MARYVMTPKRKAALRKAQLISARVRRRARKTSKKRVATSTALVLATGGLFAYNQKIARGAKRNPTVAVPVMGRNAIAARPTTPALTRRVKAIGMRRRPGRSGMVNLNRTRDPGNPYYQSRLNRGSVIGRRARRQAPPLRSNRTVFSASSTGLITVRRRRGPG